MSSTLQTRSRLMMMALWVLVLVVHQAYTLMPVMPVQLGEAATFRCVLLSEFSQRDVYWYRQRPGDTLTLIVKLTVRQQKTTSVEFAPDFLNSRWTANYDQKCSGLTIMRTSEEDEGAYHCAVMGWIGVNEWSGTYLLLEGNAPRTSNYTVVRLPTASDPTGPGDSETLQCSVFSDSDQTCSGDLSVFWFRTESGRSHPDVLYTDGNEECEKRPDKRSCFYHIFNKFSSSDAGTFHCAVATCGRILIGNVTGEHIEESADFNFTKILTLMTCLLISVIINIVFICYRTPRASRKQTNENTPPQTKHQKMTRQRPETVEDVNIENYAALSFSKGKAKRGRKKRSVPTEDSIYSQLKL